MFNEKNTEFSARQGKEITVWQSPKYVEARNKAIELIDSKKYGLTEADFWILMNETKSGKMMYSGLIISHNGCLKINDVIENKVNPKCFILDKEGFNNSLTYTYVDDDIYEVGEVSKENCKNAYPYAMAYKRCFDRVVLKKCKLAYAGVYSDSEAEEFANNNQEEIDISTLQKKVLISIANYANSKGGSPEELSQFLLKEYNAKDFNSLTYEQCNTIIDKLNNSRDRSKKQ
jgi:uncharacterized lipoprotein YehR (DUF1307 family)